MHVRYHRMLQRLSTFSIYYLQEAIVPILVCWVRHCLKIFVIQDYYLSGPQETGTDPVFIYIHSGYTLHW
jgi:acetyl esterase/lipase